MYTLVILRYGEIFLKSEFVKRQFENRLIENAQLRLKKSNLEGKIIKRRHRIYIKTRDAERVADSLRRVFGIVSVSPAVETEAEIEEICKVGLDLARKVIKRGDGFAVRVKRAGKHDFSSKDVEKALGSKILENIDTFVNLSDPDRIIFVEISDRDAFVFDKKIRCTGGLPYKTQGKVIALVSNGIDSPVAAWMMMHRGCEIIALHFGTEKEIEDILKILEEFSGYEIERYIIPYDKILKRISENSGKHACIICKRTMLRIAKKMEEIENAHGIVTGDNLGQVASQTLENLEVISEVTGPIYRPLIGMDKNEIIKMAREIGTYDLSKEIHCDFAPRNPATRSKLEEIKKLEEKIGIESIIEGIDLECLGR